MNIKEFELLIVSPFDREKLVCEIYYQKEIFAEISQETSEFMISIFPKCNQSSWEFNLKEIIELIESAKQHLIGNNQ